MLGRGCRRFFLTIERQASLIAICAAFKVEDSKDLIKILMEIIGMKSIYTLHMYGIAVIEAGSSLAGSRMTR